ncbi:MAG: hypothetical protein F6K41_32855 [Symploca sp. SIO3E6]|nr:hypothetical protein [Caldora sp. SIO3E6]
MSNGPLFENYSPSALKAGGRRQEAGGRRQEAVPMKKFFTAPPCMKISLRVSASSRLRVPASIFRLGGKKACRVSFVTFFYWWVISAKLYS